MCSRSRGAMRPEFCISLSLLKTERAQGRPGARCTRGLMCKMHKANAHEHTGSAETLRPSPRNGFTAYSALSSVTGFLATVAPEQRWLPKNLTPASGCQDHTTSPYATVALVSRAAASIASQSNVHDDREAPLLRAGMARAGSADLPDGESEIFFARRLDRFLVICPSGRDEAPRRDRGHQK